jgi:hypothetical protein
MARSLTIRWRRQKTFSNPAYKIVKTTAGWRLTKPPLPMAAPPPECRKVIPEK